ncbi:MULTISPECIES: sugar transferase [unclassified Sphingomonas]|uniref:sugar transferase n=1 Tax=unclassified Sphingomonas TaxID=196159 RepID=UPI00082B6157|nr:MULTISPECIES: sugar transferase [unclassified Sphingomonas]MCH4891864.1 polyprenyl glycosylphosphotransferase [Sphingomonas sp. SFZ2018-12]
MVSVQPKRSLWIRFDVQVIGCLCAAVLLPYVIRALTLEVDTIEILNQTLIGATLAIVAGAWLLRNVTIFPGVEKSVYILPAFTISFFTLTMIYLLGRLDYNRIMLISAFAVSVGWFLFFQVHTERFRMLRIGYLPFDDVKLINHVTGVTWVPLSSPDADFGQLDAVATDLRVDLPTEWDRRLADFALAGVPVYHVKHLLESLTGRVELEHLSENSFGSLVPLSAYMSIKHAVDWIMALIAGVVLLVPLLLVALIIRLTSSGPALFRQTRIGYRGEPFTVYKFRTMRVLETQPSTLEAAITREGDDRVTPVGRFLRHSRIDELPQIINVLRGEMSWIGPRPEAEVLSRWYEREIPFYRYRHVVRPGIAGWAQVCQGHVAEVDEVRAKLHYDFYYIKNYSPWIDLLIVARTIRTMITGFGSR